MLILEHMLGIARKGSFSGGLKLSPPKLYYVQVDFE